MIAVPTRELSGQLLAFASSREHARCATGRFGASEPGRITSARLRAASSGLNLSVVLKGGNWCASVIPGAPIEPSALGLKASLSQSVGVTRKSRSEKTFGASHEFARPSDVPSAQEVGIRMNGPLLARPFKVRAIFLIWIGSPASSLGWSANVDSRPYPSGPG